MSHICSIRIFVVFKIYKNSITINCINMNTYTTLKKRYKNGAHAKRYFTKFIKTKEGCGIFESQELGNLLSFHPRQKVPANTQRFKVQLCRKYKTPVLYFINADNEFQTVSYISCISNLYRRNGPTYTICQMKNPTNQERASAFRDVIHNSVKDFYKKNSKFAQCKKCGNQDINSLQVDHDKIPFACILDEFLSVRDIQLCNVNIIQKSNVDYQCIDSRINLEEWFQFHEQRANYVFLCKSCNATKGSSGYNYQTAKNG